MRPHPKLRKTIKWGGAAVTVLLVVVWIGSGWCDLMWVSQAGTSVSIWHGWVILGHAPSMAGGLYSPVGWYWSSSKFDLQWLPDLEERGTDWFLRLPVWPSVAVLAAVTLAAWRLDTLGRRRDRLNLCAKCNYERAGIARDAVCPECGERPKIV